MISAGNTRMPSVNGSQTKPVLKLTSGQIFEKTFGEMVKKRIFIPALKKAVDSQCKPIKLNAAMRKAIGYRAETIAREIYRKGGMAALNKTNIALVKIEKAPGTEAFVVTIYTAPPAVGSSFSLRANTSTNAQTGIKRRGGMHGLVQQLVYKYMFKPALKLAESKCISKKLPAYAKQKLRAMVLQAARDFVMKYGIAKLLKVKVTDVTLAVHNCVIEVEKIDFKIGK